MVTISFTKREIWISITEAERFGRRFDLWKDENSVFHEKSEGLPMRLDNMKLERFANEYQDACEIISDEVRKLAVVQKRIDIPSIGFKSDISEAAELWEKIISNGGKVIAFKF